MNDYALVDAGVIAAVARDPVEPESLSGDGEIVEFPADVAVPGMLWDGAVLSNPPPPEPEPPGVPRSVSMRQARLALLGAGLLDSVDAVVAQSPRAVQIEWEFATDVWRDRDLVASLGGALNLTSNQIDALFIAAKAIP